MSNTNTIKTIEIEGIEYLAHFGTIVSAATGIEYFIYESGKAEELHDEPLGCECEQDWNCPLHAHRAGTWLETRYDGQDEPEPRVNGVPISQASPFDFSASRFD